MELPEGPLDIQKLNETFMSNMDIIKQILTSFKESFVSFENEFSEAQGNNDKDLMSRLAHGLKGSAGNIRAEALSVEAAALQHAVEAEDDITNLVERVYVSHRQLMNQIDAIILSSD